jgi:LysM repeat protein
MNAHYLVLHPKSWKLMSKNLSAYCFQFSFALLSLFACNQSLSTTSQAAEVKILSIHSRTGSFYTLKNIESRVRNISKASSRNSLLAQSSGNAWFKIKQTTSIDDIARIIGLSVERIAAINEVPEDHRFHEGDWFAMPSALSHKIKHLSFIDKSSQGSTTPDQPLNHNDNLPTVRYGDTLGKIAIRTGIPIEDLIRLNPGMDSERLVVGSAIRTGQSKNIIDKNLNNNSGLKLVWPKIAALVGPFKRNAISFASYLNAHKGGWEDPSMRVYFFDLYHCSSLPSSGNESPDGYSCTGGYARISDNLGTRTCKLSNAEWTWSRGISFKSTIICK